MSARAAVAVQIKMESYGLWPTSFIGVMEKVGFRDAPAVAEAAKILIARPMNPLPPDLVLKRMPLFGDAGGGIKRVSRRCGRRQVEPPAKTFFSGPTDLTGRTC